MRLPRYSSWGRCSQLAEKMPGKVRIMKPGGLTRSWRWSLISMTRSIGAATEKMEQEWEIEAAVLTKLRLSRHLPRRAA